MKKLTPVLMFLVLVCASCVAASDVNALIKQLGSEKESERAAAIAELRKMGETAQEALTKAEFNEKMEPQHLALVRRLVGQMLVEKSELKPIDPALLTPFGEDKEKNNAGDPNLLFNKDKKIIVMNGDFALEQGPLEFLVVTRGPNARLHETVVALIARPRDICWALLACTYTYAGELGEDGKVNLPKDAGVMISVEFLWEPPQASLEGMQEIPVAIAAFRQKCEQYAKAAAPQRANLLLDLMSDVVFLRNMLDRDLTDDNSKLIAKRRSPMTRGTSATLPTTLTGRRFPKHFRNTRPRPSKQQI